jgi:uroporphyrinogen decarboxylase
VASVPTELSKARAEKPLLAVLKGERRDPVPTWMMRQAGRYLPEYRQLRHDRGSFLELVYDSDAAARITLQPLERFPEIDAAILFSDILIVPFAIGQNLTFVAGEGPRLTPPLTSANLDDLTPFLTRLEPIYETVAKVRAQLGEGKTLIGFAGSPWTVATYMVAGQGSRDQSEARRLAYADNERFGEIIARIEHVTVEYLSCQIDAGAEAVQLFDSWAGSLSPAQFEQWVIAPTARIVAALRERHAGVPVMDFRREPAASSRPMHAKPRSAPWASTRPWTHAGPQANCPRICPSRATSTRSRWLPAGRCSKQRSAACLTRSSTGLTSSISGTASCRTRRSSTWAN